ncbi:hypothetical protein D3C84_1020880 [compost metagenome]
MNTGVQPHLSQRQKTMAIGQQGQLIHACHLHARQLLLSLAGQVAQQLALLCGRAQRVGADAFLVQLA